MLNEAFLIFQQPGMDEILNRAPASINLLALCAVSHNVFARKLVFEMLTVLCYASGSGYDQDDTGSLNSSGRAAGDAAGIDGHHLVVDAFNFVRDERGERVTYELWMEHLGAVINSKAKVGASGGLVAGVGWLGDNRVTDKDLTDYMVCRALLVHDLASTFNSLSTYIQDLKFDAHERSYMSARGRRL